jgi:hypothetical protein
MIRVSLDNYEIGTAGVGRNRQHHECTHAHTATDILSPTLGEQTCLTPVVSILCATA